MPTHICTTFSSVFLVWSKQEEILEFIFFPCWLTPPLILLSDCRQNETIFTIYFSYWSIVQVVVVSSSLSSSFQYTTCKDVISKSNKRTFRKIQRKNFHLRINNRENISACEFSWCFLAKKAYKHEANIQ